MADKNVLVSLDRKNVELDLKKTQAALEAAGLKVVDIMRISKIICGITDEKKIPKLKSVTGVTAVEIDQELTAD